MHARILMICLIAALCAAPAYAVEAPQDRLKICLKKAVDMPDIAAAEADAWLRQKGGDAALLCRATAQFNRGDFAKSAEDFAQLAGNEKDPPQAAFLYQQAGVAYTRNSNFQKSEEAYGKAIKLEGQDPEIWLARANARAAAQHYWDAIGDLDQALKIMPDMTEALRLRGQVWFKLGLETKAEADFRRVAEVQAVEDVQNSKVRPAAVTKKP